MIWKHATEPEDAHPADAHHDSTGEWVCFKCRGALVDGDGHKVRMTVPPTARTKSQPVDPERPTLKDEGS